MPAMLFAATTLIDVLIPLVIGTGVQFVPIRANPPKLTEEMARKVRLAMRLGHLTY